MTSLLIKILKYYILFLSQISANTSAVSKKGRRIQKFVARTHTSPSTRIPSPPHTSTSTHTPPNNPTSPPPLPSHYSLYLPPPSFTMASQANMQEGSQNGNNNSHDSENDNSSFETVAEALRLQWSVIGKFKNRSVNPTRQRDLVTRFEKLQAILACHIFLFG